MEKIINKYKDNLGYIKDAESLYKELKMNNYDIENIIKVLNEIEINNKNIIDKLNKDNDKELKLLNSKKKEYKNYIKKNTNKKEETNKAFENKININVYVNFINNNLDNLLDILPKNNNKESIFIIDTILSYYYEKIIFLEYNLIIDSNDLYTIDEINKNKYIFDKILEYKNNLNIIEDNDIKNNLVYYMDNNIPNVFKDIDNDIETKKSIIKLIESIENGTFLNIKAFTNNDKLKGIFEVRDLQKEIELYLK